MNKREDQPVSAGTPTLQGAFADGEGEKTGAEG
jgi:hypothetical protein